MPYINRQRKKPSRYDQNKKLAQRYVYNTDRWSKLRQLKLINNPLCEVCMNNDKITPAVEVHHLTPFMTGIDIAQIKWLGFDYTNLQSICSECHQKIHQK